MGSRYADARVYTVPSVLDELHGPTEGHVVLPRHLDWGPEYVYELADRADLLLMYERVIRESVTPDDLRRHLNGSLLRRGWSELFLPAPARAAWHARFPELREAAAA